MALTRWRPQQGVTLRDAFQQLFEDAFTGDNLPSMNIANNFFPVDIRETEDAIEIDASIPGAEPADIEVTATGNTVMIRAEVEEEDREERGDLLRQERVYGIFQRAFTLPTEVDANNITANFENGVLKVRLPKSEAMKPKRVQVQGGQSNGQPNGKGNGQQKSEQKTQPASAQQASTQQAQSSSQSQQSQQQPGQTKNEQEKTPAGSR
jgi:HSP20 family protein